MDLCAGSVEKTVISDVMLARQSEGARHLDDDQPFYGLQSQRLDGKQPLLNGIEEMASHYLKKPSLTVARLL
jgi:hypothetical protein